jgi:hypothetical protein
MFLLPHRLLSRCYDLRRAWSSSWKEIAMSNLSYMAPRALAAATAAAYCIWSLTSSSSSTFAN